MMMNLLLRSMLSLIVKIVRRPLRQPMRNQKSLRKSEGCGADEMTKEGRLLYLCQCLCLALSVCVFECLHVIIMS